MTQKTRTIGRREFLKATAATTAGFTIVKPQSVRGSQANSAVRLGILGVGGRGSEVGSGFVTNAGVRVTALADLFADQLEAGRKRFDDLQGKAGAGPLAAVATVPRARLLQADRRGEGRRLRPISTPPFFHPLHLETVVAAGKHVYCEKPVAIDVPGAKKVIEIGKRAEGKLSLDVGFQIRMAPPMVELAKRLWEARSARPHPGRRSTTARSWTGRSGRTPPPTSGGCATGSGTAISRETSSSSRTYTCSTCATGSCAGTR